MSNTGLSIEPFPSFDCETDVQSIGQRWVKYLKRFNNFMEATGTKDDVRKRALLLHYVGEHTNDVFDTLANTGTTYDEAITAFNLHFVPIINIEYECYTFRQLKQLEGELIEQYHTRLRKNAVRCNFQDVDREIKSQLIVGCTNSKLRRHALKTPTATLSNLIQMGKLSEVTEQHSHEIETATKEKVNWIGPKPVSRGNTMQPHQTQWENRSKYQQTQWKNKPQYQRTQHPDNVSERETAEQRQTNRVCRNCGHEWHKNGMKECRARRVYCSKCGKQGHFANVCISSQLRNKNFQQSVAAVKEEVEPESDYAFVNTLNQYKEATADGKVKLNILGTQITFMIDSGATVDILSAHDFGNITPIPMLAPPQKNVFPYGFTTPIPLLGQMEVTLAHKNNICNAILHVSKTKGPSILSKSTSLNLNLIKFIHAVSESKVSNCISDYVAYVNRNYPGLYEGIGRCSGIQVKLHVDKDIPPICNKHRRIPFHLRQQVARELEALEKADIIERVPVNIPTPWVSPIVIVPKKDNHGIRVCVDMREPNKAIRRERHLTPTLDDMLYDLNGSAHFSKLDLRQGYHQLELDEESRSITTFTSHIGLFRYKRLTFGVNAASEVFQNTIWNIIREIPNVINLSDDILIYGKTKAQHDAALTKTLKILHERGITLNREKCVFNTGSLLFYGHVLSRQGVQVDPQKVKVIEAIPVPKDPTEARSLLGMMTFCSRFIPNLATISEPIRRLTRQNEPWHWSKEHQKAFDSMIYHLQNSVTLAYFDKDADTEIWTDASPTGIAGILVQNKDNQMKVLAFASRTLSDTESRYAQIEREALAIAWAIEYFRIYVAGSKFKVITDHKPLVNMFNNPRANLSVRIERWRMNIQNNDFEVMYRDGKRNPADYLSRHPQGDEQASSKLALMADQYAHLMAIHDVPKNVCLAEIERETSKDVLMQFVIRSLKTYFKKNDIPPGVDRSIYEQYYKIRQELATNKNGTLLLRGAKLVIPASLQDRIINIAHEGHSGIVKTKQLIRTKVWFAHINKKVEEKIKNCLQCQSVSKLEHKMPLQSSELPDGPWCTLHVDHKGPLPTGEHLLVVMDTYTRFPVVEVVRSTAASENIEKLDNLFALFGQPKEIVTDNGSPYNSREFAQLMRKHGIRHRRVTPAWPQANGAVERFNRTLNKTLKIAFTFKEDWKQAIRDMLRIYRISPHSATQLSPGELMFNRTMRSGIPTISVDDTLSPAIAKEMLTVNDQCRKSYNQEYHDAHNKLMTPLQLGDRVLLRQEQRNKGMTAYDPRPYTVTDIIGSRVTSERPGHRITRNASLYKAIPKDLETDGPLTKLFDHLDREREDSSWELPTQELKTASTTDRKNLDHAQAGPEVIPTPADNTDLSMAGNRYSLRTKTKPPERLIETMN